MMGPGFGQELARRAGRAILIGAATVLLIGLALGFAVSEVLR